MWNQKKVSVWRGHLGAAWYLSILSLRKPGTSRPKNLPFSSQEIYLKIQLITCGCYIDKILNEVVESQLFASLYKKKKKKNHQWLSDNSLNQIRAFVSFLSQY